MIKNINNYFFKKIKSFKKIKNFIQILYKI